MGLKDRWGMLASTWLPCPRTGHGFHPTAPHSTALVTAQHLCPWSKHISRAATAASDLPWGLYITFCFWLQARAWNGSVVGVCNLCTAGRKNKSNSLSGRIFLIIQVQTPGARFRVMGVCQPSQSEMLLKLCRGWGCWYRLYIRLVYLSCFNLFSCVLFSCARVCMRERRDKKGKTLPGTFGYHCREGPVSDLIFTGRWLSTVNPCRNFKKQAVDGRLWFMRPDSPTSQVTLQYEEVCTSALLRSFKYRDISR